MWPALAFAALGFVLSGCGPPIVPVADARALIRSASDRVGGLDTFYCRPGKLRYRGPIKPRADIYLASEGRFRLDIRHPFSGTRFYALVVNGGRFLFVDDRKHKGREGGVMEVIRGRYPKIDVSPENLSAWQLFLPTVGIRTGEKVAMARLGRTYVLEFWKPDHIPTRRVEVDARTHLPRKKTFFRKDGSVAAELSWRRFAEHAGEARSTVSCSRERAGEQESREGSSRATYAQEVRVSLPKLGRSLVLYLSEPKVNEAIKDAVFDLQREKRKILRLDGKIEEVKPEPVKEDAAGKE